MIFKSGRLILARLALSSTISNSPEKGRVVPVPKRTAEYLNRWFDETPAATDGDLIFFGSFPGKPINRRYVNVLFDTALERAGIEKNGFQPYSFRRYYNTRMRTELKADALLRQLMGHKTAGMTDTYDTPAIDQMIKRIEDARDATSSNSGSVVDRE